MRILVTGCAGFIGYHLSKRLVEDGFYVVGLDNLNHYYDVRLKLDRLRELGINAYDIAMGKSCVKSSKSNFKFYKIDLVDRAELDELFEEEKFDVVFNLAAQAGVRYSIEKPESYVDSNLVGFANLLESCRHFSIKHLIYASSSSVYGNNSKVPFETKDNVDHPISFYAATKKCNELMAHAYSHLFNFKCTGLRFFTVYGEWGRPDMALMLFAKAIMNNDPIDVYNNGEMSRDFTYVGDIVDGLLKILNLPLNASKGNYNIYNIGSSRPIKLLDFIESLEEKLSKKAIKNMLPMQPGDVKQTFADISDLTEDYGYMPQVSLDKGLNKFCDWYSSYYLSKNDLIKN